MDFYSLSMHIGSTDSFGLHYYNAGPNNVKTQWALGENFTYNQATSSQGRFYYSPSSSVDLPAEISVAHLDSVVLSSSMDIYNDVIKFSCSASQGGNWIETEYYVRNIGVVKRELFNGEIWEIQNYIVVQ